MLRDVIRFYVRRRASDELKVEEDLERLSWPDEDCGSSESIVRIPERLGLPSRAPRLPRPKFRHPGSPTFDGTPALGSLCVSRSRFIPRTRRFRPWFRWFYLDSRLCVSIRS
jgi:hypothetical protein